MKKETQNTARLYTDLAWLWPLWGDAATEYAHYCRHVTDLVRQYSSKQAITLLDIGCGGGKNVLNLKRDFQMHEGAFCLGEDEYRTFVGVKAG